MPQEQVDDVKVRFGACHHQGGPAIIQGPEVDIGPLILQQDLDHLHVAILAGHGERWLADGGVQI
jgi:hypothetical protein